MFAYLNYKNKIHDKIEELKSDQEYYRGCIDNYVHVVKAFGGNVHKYEDITFVYNQDGTLPDLVQGSIRRCEGVIQGLQFAIDALEKEL